jgi:hypothetical protein
MKLITTLSFSIVLIISAQAQEYKLSLAEAIETGLKNKIALKNQQLTVNLAENEKQKHAQKIFRR